MITTISRRLFAAVTAVALALPGLALAEGLRVTPVLLEIAAPGSASTLTIRNEGRTSLSIQARVFRWTQQGGSEKLDRTSDVVVSPPAVQLAPGATQTVRVIRTHGGPVRGEEAYRVVMNEIPDQSRRQASAVAFATELRIPVFFAASNVRMPDVSWSLRQSGSATWLVAANRGESRLRLADVQLHGASGAKVSHPSLLGYVLGGTTMQWPIAPAGRLGGSARLTAATNVGPLNAGVAAR